jgi:predicted ATPase
VNSVAPGGFTELAWRGAGRSDLVTLSVEGNFAGLGWGFENAEWRYVLEFLGSPSSVFIQNESLTLKRADQTVPLISKDERGQRTLRNDNGTIVSTVPHSDRSALEFEIPDWTGNLVRRYFTMFRFYNFIPAVMKQANPTMAVGALDENGSNLSAWLMMLQTRFREESFDKIRQAAMDVFPDLTNVFTQPTPQSTVFLGSHERYLSTPVPVWQMSDGELCFLAFLTVIFCPLELGAPLYCIEEPENHLHQRLLAALVGLTEQRMRAGEAGQLIATTHSSHLVDKLRPEEVLIIEKREGETRCVRASEKRQLRELLEREDVGLGELYYSGALSGA